MKTALVTGATGQDGAYLARHLIDNDYKVYGTMRRSSTLNDWRLRELNLLDEPNFHLVEHDVTDIGSTMRLLSDSQPEEVYNLAAQSFVGVSFDQPSTTAQITGIGTLNVLEAIRVVDPSIRFYQASTSEMFGKVQATPQSESTDFYPRSPYGVAKLFAHWTTVNYRESYDIFASSGILFNHESPLRGPEFVTRKITLAAAAISQNQQDTLELGNLSAKRDWGYAKEYVVGMHKILQAPTPDTFVLATGRTATVREFVTLAFEAVDLPLDFEGEGENEVGVCAKTRKPIVKINPAFYRPAEVELLVGDASKAADELGWRAETTLEQLVSKMVAADLKKSGTN